MTQSTLQHMHRFCGTKPMTLGSGLPNVHLTRPADTQYSSAFDAIMDPGFERQLKRLDRLMTRLSRILDRLGGGIGGGDCWTQPIRHCGTGGGNHWESGWPGGGNADPGQVIAGKGRIWGDPHFVGADGGKYDVQGEAGKIYNLLSDDGFQMNGRFDAWGSGGATVVGEVGINAKGNRINVSGDGSVTVNGRELKDGERVRLAHGGFVKKDGDNITVKSGEWKVEFQAKDSSRGDYLNMDVSTKNAVADGVKPHGLLGQTFDGDGIARNGDKGKGAQGGGAIEDLSLGRTERGDKSAIYSYEVSSLMDTNSTSFNRYTDLSASSLDANFFGGGFDNGWGMSSSSQAMQVAMAAYGTLAISLVSSTSLGGWSGMDWNKYT